MSEEDIEGVSVPLRGNGYETITISFGDLVKAILFPSPCGEMGMKRRFFYLRLAHNTMRFRPLAGKWV